MTPAEALEVGWYIALPIAGFLMTVAVGLLGLALIREISR